MQVSRETGGAYDITAGPLWEAWGFARRAGAVPEKDRLDEARALVGGHLVELDAVGRTVRFLKPGVRLNLGSVGKGFAVDRCGETLLRHGIEDFLVHGGNSSVLAHGSPTPPAVSSAGRRLDRRPSRPAPPATKAPRTAAVRSGVGHVGGPVPVVSPSRQAVWAHSRSADRLARRGGVLGHGDRPVRRFGGHPFDRLLRARPGGGLGLLSATSGNRRGHSLSCFAGRRDGGPFRRPGGWLAASEGIHNGYCVPELRFQAGRGGDKHVAICDADFCRRLDVPLAGRRVGAAKGRCSAFHPPVQSIVRRPDPDDHFVGADRQVASLGGSARGRTRSPTAR